jgi:hypothetical protein
LSFSHLGLPHRFDGQSIGRPFQAVPMLDNSPKFVHAATINGAVYGTVLHDFACRI